MYTLQLIFAFFAFLVFRFLNTHSIGNSILNNIYSYTFLAIISHLQVTRNQSALTRGLDGPGSWRAGGMAT